MKMFTRRFYTNYATIQNEFKGKPINHMEIGVFLGHTSEWCLDNILTHPDARFYGIDPWESIKHMKRRFPTPEAWKEKMLDRIDMLRVKYAGKAEFIKGYSQDVLMEPRWQKHSMDFIYIDGHHTTLSVLRDFVLTWRLLKVGGVMMFDDYLQGHSAEVKIAVDTILFGLNRRIFRTENTRQRGAKVELLFKNFAVGIRKLED